MKTRTMLMITAAFFGWTCPAGVPAANSNGNKGQIVVTSAPELRDMTAKWVGAFHRQDPGIIINTAGYDGNDPMKSGTDIAFLVDDGNKTAGAPDPWKMVIGRDVIVMVTGVANPFMSVMRLQGVAQGKLALLCSDPGRQKWGTLLGNDEGAPVRIFIVNEASLGSSVAQFLGVDPAQASVTLSKDGPDLVSAIMKDPGAIGFCRLTDVLDNADRSIVEGISLLPVDKNGNGKLDRFENIYGSMPDFLRGVWIGKYPAALTRSIVALAPSKPEKEEQVAFLKWVLDDGQQFLNPNGFIDLGYNEREAKSALLVNKNIMVSVMERGSPYKTTTILLVIFLATVLFMIWIAGYRRYEKPQAGGRLSRNFRGFDENSVSVPKGLWFDKSHTWVFMEQNGVVRIGIDDFLQHITGKLTRVKIKRPGEQVQKGEDLFTIIQDGKQLKISSPVSGRVREQNGILAVRSGVINSDPYHDGWICTIEPSNWLRETKFLFMADKYREWLKNEFTRLKDFFAADPRVGDPQYASVVLQDGGVLHDNILAGFGPEVWEDFQVKYLGVTT